MTGFGLKEELTIGHDQPGPALKNLYLINIFYINNILIILLISFNHKGKVPAEFPHIFYRRLKPMLLPNVT